MLKMKNKVQQGVEQRKLHAVNKDVVNSLRDFKKGLLKGETQIGSWFFDGSTEKPYIEKLCRYYGIDIIKVKKLLCSHPQCTNKFYITHYFIKWG